MSTMEEELEEGEITDSDSMGEEQKVEKPVEKPPAQHHYSMFDNHQPRTAPVTKSIPRPHHSDSDNSADDDDNDYSDDDNVKRRKFPGNKTSNNQAKPFVNPNYVRNGGKMPPVPKQSNRSIWGSILQEQILTAEVGSFSMEKPLPSDRDVESYDYSRAKDDDRPHPVEDELKGADEDLFGEVIDLEKAAFKQRRNLKRKNVTERLGRRPSVKERLKLPQVTESSPVEEVSYFISNELQETKVHLIRRVVHTVGQAKALDLLKETEKVEAGGGMLTMNGARRRTPGGVYLILLKNDKDVSKEQLDEIFEEENRWMMEMRKRKKARARKRKRGQNDAHKPSNPSTAPKDRGGKPSSMEVVENGESNMKKQTSGDSRSTVDPRSMTAGSCDRRDEDSEKSDSASEDTSEPEDFDGQLAAELKRQAAAKEAKEPSASGDADAITLDDVLDIEVEDDFLD